MKNLRLLTVIGMLSLWGCDAGLNAGSNGVRGLGDSNRTNGDANNLGGAEAGAAPGAPIPAVGAASARIINGTDTSADVELQYFVGEVRVHFTFVRVPEATTLTITGPEEADRMEISTVAENGSLIEPRTYIFGIDFDEDMPAEYVIGAFTDGENVPPTMAFLSPVSTLTVNPGGEITVTFVDEDPDSAALISFLLDDNDQPADGTEIVLAEGIEENLEGVADQVTLVLPNDLAAQDYRLFGVIEDEASQAIVQAPGLIRVTNEFIDPADGGPTDSNVAPSIAITEPAGDIQVFVGGSFTASWIDDDPDDDALITLFLEGDGVDADDLQFVLAAGVSEDSANDSLLLFVGDIAPGNYNLFAEISDGQQTAVAQAAGQIIVTESPENGSPTLTLFEPMEDVSVQLGESLFVSWEASDDAQNAELTLYLDNNAVNLDAGEIWIGAYPIDTAVATAQEAFVQIVNVSPGTYTLLGVATDGDLVAFDRALGRVTVTQPAFGGPGNGGAPNNPVIPDAVCTPLNFDGVDTISDDDFETFRQTFGLAEGDEGYVQAADTDDDGVITFLDLQTFNQCRAQQGNL